MESIDKLSIFEIKIDECPKEKITIKLNKTDDSLYFVCNYDKSALSFNDKKLGKYRSVIFSFLDKKVLSFSPPKSIPLSYFVQKNPSFDYNIFANQIIEGTLIHLFYDEGIRKWEIATKGAVGGKYNFYGKISKKEVKTKTFYKMFLEAMRALPNQELNDLPFLKYLPTCTCFSFVLQHPENEIHLQIKYPRLYLVATYLLARDGTNNVEYLPPDFYENWSEFQNMKGIIEFPKQFNDVNSYEELLEKHCSIQSSSLNVGIMITNTNTGERTCVYSPAYERYKNSISVSPNLQYIYFCLRKTGKLYEYVQHFSYLKKSLFLVRDEFEQFISDVHKSYIIKYIYKSNIEISDKHLTHIMKLHNSIYIPSLYKHTLRVPITRKIVMEYFDKMEPRELLYIYNWTAREILSNVI
jgi:hypothetical protein